jgi:hypothetical protein
MKTRNAKAKLIALVIALTTVAVIWVGSDQGRVTAANGGVWKTGMFGLARGQTARINAANLFERDAIYLEVMFLDRTGNVVARSERLQVSPRAASFLDLPFERLFPTETVRVELRAVVQVIDNPDVRQLNFSAEVFDNDTFKSTLYVPSDSFEECACGAQ